MSTPETPTDASRGAGLTRPRLRQVGVREFRDHASQLMAAGDILAIERHGHTIGYFIPVKSAASARARAARARLEEAISEAKAAGLFDDEMLDESLAPEEALPYAPRR
jgi:antitoxin (DNA-binding transcriptional repressor) of toxin-antitoxin stability system